MEDSVQDSSNINPIALLFLLAMGMVVLQGRRQMAVCAMLATAAFLPLGQQVVLFGLHFTFFRILILVGLARLLTSGETRGVRFNRLDKLVMAWALVVFVCNFLRKPEAWAGASCLGALYSNLGAYFLFRFFIRDPDDIVVHLRFLAVAAMIIGVEMACEVITHKNLFHVFGGVPEFVDERDGRLRCQGPFEHPILAGTFAATLFPLMAGLWLQGGPKKWLALPGIISSAFCTFVAASSGALLTCLAAMIGLGLWSMRNRMNLFRRGAVVLIIILSLIMKAPVWYLIAKVSDVFGGTGWFRSYLIDQAVGHFGQWWLIGTSHTANWAPSGLVLAADPDNMDITNHYIAQGINGGVLGLGLFIAMIVTGFKVIGRAWRDGDVLLLEPKLLWTLGVCLACHCTAFISISYFDQMQVFWIWLLAVFSALLTREKETTVLGPALQPVEDVHETNTLIGTVSKEAVSPSGKSPNPVNQQIKLDHSF
jgi:hypothetical protein